MMGVTEFRSGESPRRRQTFVKYATAQPFRLLGAEGRRDGAIRPGQPSLRGLVDGPEPRRRYRQNATLSFDQDVARIGGGGGDDGDPATAHRCFTVAADRQSTLHANRAKSSANKTNPGTAAMQQPPMPFTVTTWSGVAPTVHSARTGQGIWRLHHRRFPGAPGWLHGRLLRGALVWSRICPLRSRRRTQYRTSRLGKFRLLPGNELLRLRR